MGFAPKYTEATEFIIKAPARSKKHGLLMAAIEHIPAPANYLRCVKPNLAKDGVLLIQVPGCRTEPV
jgi:hypothetical protein